MAIDSGTGILVLILLYVVSTFSTSTGSRQYEAIAFIPFAGIVLLLFIVPYSALSLSSITHRIAAVYHHGG
jgi:hypothetical protein